jgi:hypothetical protein
MKNLKTSLTVLLLLALTTAFAQDSKKEDKPKVENKTFHFTAEYISPMKGGRRYLTGNYFLTVTNESVICELPYVGRVYSPSMSGDGGIKFMSTDFTVETKARKKGGWDITVRTKDTSGNFVFRVTMFEDKTGSIGVTASDRESINYSGKFSDVKP